MLAFTFDKNKTKTSKNKKTGCGQEFPRIQENTNGWDGSFSKILLTSFCVSFSSKIREFHKRKVVFVFVFLFFSF